MSKKTLWEALREFHDAVDEFKAVVCKTAAQELWNIGNWLAKNWGWFRYEGLRDHQPAWWPTGHVIYEDGMPTDKMALGNAWTYARLDGPKARVVRELEQSDG